MRLYFVIIVTVLVFSLIMIIKGSLVGIPIFFFCMGWMLGAVEGFGRGRT